MDDIRRPTPPNVERALGVLKKGYVVVDRRHVRKWRLLLILGVVAGIAIAIFIIAKRSS